MTPDCRGLTWLSALQEKEKNVRIQLLPHDTTAGGSSSQTCPGDTRSENKFELLVSGRTKRVCVVECRWCNQDTHLSRNTHAQRGGRATAAGVEVMMMHAEKKRLAAAFVDGTLPANTAASAEEGGGLPSTNATG